MGWVEQTWLTTCIRAYRCEVSLRIKCPRRFELDTSAPLVDVCFAAATGAAGERCDDGRRREMLLAAHAWLR